jgi:hypothetical protein
MIDPAEVERAREMLNHPSVVNSDEYRELETLAEILGYAAALSRAHGWDEADTCELIVRAGDVEHDVLIEAERLLRKLRYTKIADRLIEVLADTVQTQVHDLQQVIEIVDDIT